MKTVFTKRKRQAGITLTLVLGVHVHSVFPFRVLVIKRFDVGEDATIVYGEVFRITHPVLYEAIDVSVIVCSVHLNQEEQSGRMEVREGHHLRSLDVRSHNIFG